MPRPVHICARRVCYGRNKDVVYLMMRRCVRSASSKLADVLSDDVSLLHAVPRV